MNPNMYRNVILATAATITCALAGFGQELTATVDFPFAVASTAMPAGTYEIRKPDTPSPMLVLRNAETGKSVVVLSPYISYPPDDFKFAMNFACATDGCRLGSIHWGGRVYAGPATVKSAAAHERTVAVALRARRQR